MNTAALALTVLTLNVAGPQRVHHGWQTRRAALTARLAAEPADVAAFQNVWRDEDVAALARSAGLDYQVADTALGLAVIGRIPLQRGPSRDLGWGGGVLRARLSALKRQADVYSVRLTAGDDASATAHRHAQLLDLAEFIRAQSTGSFVILGDLAAPPDSPEIRLFFDLLDLRDLCVSHGDEMCGRTFGDQRVDYILIPYSSRAPRRTAHTSFTETSLDEDEVRPLSTHFGLAGNLDSSWLKLSPAAKPEGRLEALSATADALDAARAKADLVLSRAGWLPWQGAFAALALRDESALLGAAAQRARTALALMAAPAQSK
ncbi:MAG: endonuclease/exonuclease/phosphatase family protein [Elusimicrobiota bacterium]